jgi:hypothetical protein
MQTIPACPCPCPSGDEVIPGNLLVEGCITSTRLPVGGTIYVNSRASPGGSGSLLCPFNSIQTAINTVPFNNGTTMTPGWSIFQRTVLQIAPGTYDEDLVFQPHQHITLIVNGPVNLGKYGGPGDQAVGPLRNITLNYAPAINGVNDTVCFSSDTGAVIRRAEYPAGHSAFRVSGTVLVVATQAGTACTAGFTGRIDSSRVAGGTSAVITATAVLTNGSFNVTATSGFLANTIAGQYITFAAQPNVTYRVSNVTSDSAITLTTAYTGVSTIVGSTQNVYPVSIDCSGLTGAGSLMGWDSENSEYWGSINGLGNFTVGGSFYHVNHFSPVYAQTYTRAMAWVCSAGLYITAAPSTTVSGTGPPGIYDSLILGTFSGPANSLLLDGTTNNNMIRAGTTLTGSLLAPTVRATKVMMEQSLVAAQFPAADTIVLTTNGPNVILASGTVTLPSATIADQHFYIKNISPAPINVNPVLAQLIDNVSPITLDFLNNGSPVGHNAIEIISSGGEWYIISVVDNIAVPQ